jgi:hypothetical protein
LVSNEVTIHGEEIVCPYILGNCFVQGDVMQAWYMALAPEAKRSMISGAGCRERFKIIMIQTWDQLLGVKQTQANDITKAPTENFVQYAISKYAALRKAYPTANVSFPCT